jgi:hypothetical protein
LGQRRRTGVGAVSAVKIHPFRRPRAQR